MVAKTLVTRCTGINNKLNPKRLVQYDPKTGVTDLAEGQNIDIDDSGMIARRLGQVEISSVASHTVFCDGGDCFVVQDRTSDAAILQLSTDFSTLTGIRSSLTKGARVSFCQVGDRTYYSNGVQNGYIKDAVSSQWPDTSGHVGSTTEREFYPAPVGNHVAYFLGCFWISVGSVIYVSEPYSPGKFRLLGRMFQFGSDVRMIRPVDGGVWVSDSKQTGFIQRADDFKAMSWVKKSAYPAHEWSDNCQLVDLSETRLRIPGMSAVWSSDEGLCIGTADGQLENETESKLNYPKGSSGATVVSGSNVINNVV